MKIIACSCLGALMLVFSGCLKTDPPVYNHSNVPAKVTLNYTTLRLMLETPVGTYHAPELPDEYFDGDIIWVSFTVDGGNQPYSDVTLASELTVHGRVEYGYVREAPEDMTDDYTTPIDGFFANTVSIGQTLFFGFSQEAKAGQTFTYELLYKLESEMATIPTLFIKARVVTEGTGAETVINTPIGFNMSAFIATYKKADQGLVNFYIRYYQGTDAEGNELYTSPQSQPFNWILE